MIQGLFDSGAIPTLERFVQFTGARHRVLANNIANLSNPYFKPGDIDPDAFQAELRTAIDKRRGSPNPTRGPLDIRDTDDVRFRGDRVEITASAMNDNILFHDQNNRNLERNMQDLAENAMAHNAAIDMIKNQFDMLKLAIRERI